MLAVSEKAIFHPKLTDYWPISDAQLGVRSNLTPEPGGSCKLLSKNNLESLAYDFVRIVSRPHYNIVIR